LVHTLGPRYVNEARYRLEALPQQAENVATDVADSLRTGRLPMSAPVSVRPVTADDIPEIAALHARVFGPGRFARSAYRVRDGAPLFSRFCLVSYLDGKLIAAIRFAEVTIGGKGGALLLGPLAVESRLAGQGYGTRLIAQGLENVKAAGMYLVVLVGDEPYYGRFGFRAVPPNRIVFPGPVDPTRILAAELTPGALAKFQGMVAAAR
jgi:predicted N-acetyltransferase YhbS